MPADDSQRLGRLFSARWTPCNARDATCGYSRCVVVVCRRCACGMTNSRERYMLHTLRSKRRMQSYCSLQLKSGRLNLNIPDLNEPSARHTHHTRRRQVWRLHLALQRRPSRRPSSAGTFYAAAATSTRRTSAQQPPCRRPAHWSCAPPVLLEPLQLCSRFSRSICISALHPSSAAASTATRRASNGDRCSPIVTLVRM